MKAIYLVPIIALAAAGSAAVVVWRSSTRPVAPSVVAPEPAVSVVEPRVAPPPSVAVTNPVPADVKTPVQSIEERGDAMLFEIDALHNTPFDDAITRPFD